MFVTLHFTSSISLPEESSVALLTKPGVFKSFYPFPPFSHLFSSAWARVSLGAEIVFRNVLASESEKPVYFHSGNVIHSGLIISENRCWCEGFITAVCRQVWGCKA